MSRQAVLSDEPPNGIGPALATMLVLVLLVAAGTFAVRSCVAKRAARDMQLEAAAFDRGLTFGLEIAAAVGDGKGSCNGQGDIAPADLAVATCRAELADYRRTEAANRANARILGWNDGYAVGREDWRVQPWECPSR